MKIQALILAALVATAASPAFADSNVALGATVTAVSGANSISNATALSAVTDGIFAPEDTAYHSSTGVADAVEWSGATSGTISGSTVATGLVMDINLGGTYTIDGAILQGDDNDAYLIQYWDLDTNSWATLYNVGVASVGNGLVTRPNGDQTTYEPVGPVVTDMVQVSAVSGDGGYAVSEVELSGTAYSVGVTPEPGSLVLLGTGLLALGVVGLKQRLS